MVSTGGSNPPGLGSIPKCPSHGGYSNGKKVVSKTTGSTALTRDMRVRISLRQPKALSQM